MVNIDLYTLFNYALFIYYALYCALVPYKIAEKPRAFVLRCNAADAPLHKISAAYQDLNGRFTLRYPVSEPLQGRRAASH